MGSAVAQEGWHRIACAAGGVHDVSVTTVVGGAGERLLERHAAMVLLREALAKASGGDGQVVLLSGEAGIGKTALARALCGTADVGTRVLEGACDALFLPR